MPKQRKRGLEAEVQQRKIEFDAAERQRTHKIKLKQMEIERQLQISRNTSETTLSSCSTVGLHQTM